MLKVHHVLQPGTHTYRVTHTATHTHQATNPEVKACIDRGDMVSDALVGDILLEVLLHKACQQPDGGVLIDGFPRTAAQVR